MYSIQHLKKSTLLLHCLLFGALLCLPMLGQSQIVPGEIGQPDKTVPGYDTWYNPAGFASLAVNSSATNVASMGSWRFGSKTSDPLRTEDDLPDYLKAAFIEHTISSLYIDETGEEVIVGDEDGRFLREPAVNIDTQSGSYLWEYKDDTNNYTVEFNIKLVRDVIKWEYRICNLNTRSKRIGFRTTAAINFFGNPSGYYYFPSSEAQVRKQELLGSQIPSEWFIHYTPPFVQPADIGYRPLWKARMLLSNGSVTRPTRVAFASEDELADYGWAEIIESQLPENYDEDPLITWGTPLDPESFCVGLYYPIQSLGVRQTRVISGQSEFNWATVETFQHNALAVYTPDWVGYREGNNPVTTDVQENGYFEPAEIPIRAYVNNSSFITAPQVSVTIDPGPGLQLALGQPRSYTLQLSGLDDLLCSQHPNSDKYSWKVLPDGTASGLIPIRVTASFTPGGAITNTTYVNVPAIPSRTIGTGDNLIGFPFKFDNTDARVALGLGSSIQLASYEPIEKEYRYAATDGVEINPGRAYWLRLETPATVQMVGADAVDQRSPYRVQLQQGWNLISNPFQYSIEWGKCRVYNNGAEYSISDALHYGMIRAELWSWNAEDGIYNPPTNPSPQNQMSTEIKPYTGYWLYAIDPVLLVFMPNQFLPVMNPNTPGARSRAVGSNDQWQVNIQVKAAGIKDIINTFGVDKLEQDGPSQGDVMKPPVSPSGLSAYFVRRAWGNNSGNYAIDLQAPGTIKSWSFEVQCLKPNVQVELRWPDLTKVPSHVPILVTDEMTGRQFAMRSCAVYTFDSGNGGTRRFTITAGGTLPVFQITQLLASKTRGTTEGINILYGTSSPADIRINIRSINGRLIRTLTPSRAENVNVQSVTWDGRDQSKRMMPKGLYLLEIVANTDDRQEAKRTITVNK